MKTLKYKVAITKASNFDLENKLKEATLLHVGTLIKLAEKSMEKIYHPTTKQMTREQPHQSTIKSKTEKVYLTFQMNLFEPQTILHRSNKILFNFDMNLSKI